MSSSTPLSKILFMIIILVAVGQMTQTMYVPSMTMMADSFNVSPALLQAVMACYLIPYGLSQFIYGPLSDRFGRKPIILIGLAIYLLGTVVTLVALNYNLFLLGTVIQGLGIGCGGAMARTLTRDCFDGSRLHKANSLVSIGLIFSPLMAPVIGGVLSTRFGWEASYVFLFVLAAVVYLIMSLYFTETLPPEVRRHDSVLKSYHHVMSNRRFQGYLICLIAVFSGISVFEAAAGVLLGSTLGLSATTVSVLFVLPLPGFMVGSWLSSVIEQRMSAGKTLLVGSVVLLLGALTVVVPGYFVTVTVDTLIGGAFLYFMGAGLLFPAATTGAISPFPRHAGTAGAVMGGVQNMAAGLFTLLAAKMNVSDQFSLGAILLAMAVVSGLGLLLCRRHKITANTTVAA
ncbi:Bcr/CflA family drug resistance efflux transporter [Grimontia hollisae]|uniref:Multidrug resistance protein D n=3 Tax=Grimontia hollisae TaxID=673 RepID=D0IAW3_GRIHO|nr:multidrug efflux MFS transporter EmrD [Grimontia hollisae]AMG31980.2 Bcr/CflA family drug resistance efflux transporter [Grimontia hollisae]EEY71031.1 multidrug resistance protein D [Grimontia hollisae CIP 101886]STO44279.1 Multidrug resistance protein D [Grimontia hollisae]STO57289.1 Multidrug resistance protein D [Grimontia hollisae]